MRQKKGNRIKLITVLSIMLMLSFSGCNMPSELSEEFEEEKVLAASEDVVAAINAGDFSAIEDMVEEDFKGDINAEMLEEALSENLKELGKFDSYSDRSVVGLNSEDYDGELAVAVINATYENGSMALTISYNTDYEIVGFYAN